MRQAGCLQHVAATRHHLGDNVVVAGQLPSPPQRGSWLERQIPADRWRATPASGPASEPLAHPDYPAQTFHATTVNGCVNNTRYSIHIGAQYDGLDATIIIDTNRANVFINDQLIRPLELDPTRRYQPSGRPRGGPHGADSRPGDGAGSVVGIGSGTDDR